MIWMVSVPILTRRSNISLLTVGSVRRCWIQRHQVPCQIFSCSVVFIVKVGAVYDLPSPAHVQFWDVVVGIFSLLADIGDKVEDMANFTAVMVDWYAVLNRFITCYIFLIIESEWCKYFPSQPVNRYVGGVKILVTNGKLNSKYPEGGRSCVGSPLAVVARPIEVKESKIY